MSLDAYLRFYEELSPETLDRLDEVAAETVRFVDPFNDVRGRAALRRVLEHMLATLEEPRFRITHRARDGDVAFVRWRFTSRLRGRAWEVEGVSELRLDAGGLVVEHVDHWDASTQFYARLPVVGPLIRLIRRRLSAGPS
ncbi:nuclear transport factor 2 family protein [Arenibaculum sp.]|uniref:nuclear transport factor 2 family protein n=1 Tax=Arenibaculum sp. TaxID=2865862 RepID=UPI002E0D1A8E|nr:nuclear transport factor 2 family protein [Arenibaculum sp.]